MSFASDRAIEILNRYWNRQLPVDIHAIAKDMNVNVVERHEWGAITPPDGITAQESDRSYDISGRFDYVNNIPTATIRTTDPWVRQRFTLAHELGHYALGHPPGFRDNAASVANFSNYDRAEVDANAFAAELLMPQFMVDYLIEVKNKSDIDELAGIFAVSRQAIYWRLKNLGWLA
jgi:hypothetical protein